MKKRNLVLFLPSVHRGYLDFLRTVKSKIDFVYVLDVKVLDKLSVEKPPLHALTSEESKKILICLGYKKVASGNERILKSLYGQPISLIADDVSRKLAQKYFSESDIEWHDVFLRWDRSSVMSTEPVGAKRTKEQQHVECMRHAKEEAKKSGDWWRQVGAVLVRNGEISLRAHNSGCPDDQTLYQDGQVRDYMKVGERPDFANTIHAEQKIIASAAQQGIVMRDTTLYVTHFPCPVCAKLIAFSGVSVVYFSEGSSSLDAKKILEAFGVKLFLVTQKTIR